MRIRPPRRLEPHRDIEEKHLALADDPEALAQTVEAQRETAAHGPEGHLRP